MAQEKKADKKKANEKTATETTVTNAVMDGNVEDESLAFGEKRKCIKAGGTFYEWPNGNKKCIPASASAAEGVTGVSTTPVVGMSDRKKCLNSGGVWATKSSGSFCYKKLKSDY